MHLKAFAVATALGLALVGPVAARTITSAPEQASAIQQLNLPAPDGRTIEISVWPAAGEERGVIVFSHGMNGNPEPYQRVLEAWADHGFTVLAPLHVDSLRHPEHGRYDNRTAFMARITDLTVVRGHAQEAYAGRPLVAAGHSFGSLMSLISAGAVTAAGPLGDPAVQGVIAFSSAGDVPGLVTPQTYEALTTPLLMITGDADLVPGFVSDWTQHRSPFDRSPPGAKHLIVFDGGGHNLVGRAAEDQLALILQATETFLDAYAAGDAGARARLAEIVPPAGVTIEHR